MTSPTTYRKAVVRYLRDEYGVAEVEEPSRAGGGDHPRLRFHYAGRERTLTLHGTGGKLAGNALAMKLQDIRRDLGAPPPRGAPACRRRLEDMMPDLPLGDIHAIAGPIVAKGVEPLSSYPPKPPASGIGKVALYESNGVRLIRFVFPETVARRFGVDDPVRITQGDSGFWQIKHVGKGRSRITNDAKRGLLLNKVDRDGALSVGLALFPATPAEFECDGEVIRVRALFDQARLPRKSGRPKKGIKPDAVPALHAPQADGTATADIRAALEAVRRVEAETAYRLVKLKDPERWAFRAVVE